jgi:hypothetical protein
MGGEFSRKVRIIVRSIRGQAYFGHLLNPLRYPRFVFQTVSHKIVRRLVPFLLLVMLAASALSDHALAGPLLVAQLLFYAAAVLGLLLKHFMRPPRLLAVPVYFTVVNAAAFVAWFMVFKDFGVWSRIGREETPSGASAARACRSECHATRE